MLPDIKKEIVPHPESSLLEQLYVMVSQLTQSHPELFSVGDASNDWHTAAYGTTLINSADGHQYALSLSISARTNEFTDGFYIRKGYEMVYRFDARHGQKALELYETHQELIKQFSKSNPEAASALAKLLADFSTNFGPDMVHFSDNWAESELSADQVKTLIDTAQSLELPRLQPGEMTLANFITLRNQHNQNATSTLDSLHS